MSIVPDAGARSDAELITSVRAGDEAAFGVLYQRHVESARAAARALAVSKSDVDDLVSEAFARVLSALKRGAGPEIAFRPYLLTSVRNVFYDRTRKDRRVDVRDEVPETINLAEVDHERAAEDAKLAAAAFLSLPERWQTVLWYTEVEGRQPAEVAPMLGLAPNAVAALAYRAREGLRQAYLQAHLQAPPPEACRDTVAKLGAYVRDGLSSRDRRKVEEHLQGCASCTALLAELRETSSTLRGALLPFVLGVPAALYLKHLAVGGSLAWLRPRTPKQLITTGAVATSAVTLAVAGGVALRPTTETPTRVQAGVAPAVATTVAPPLDPGGTVFVRPTGGPGSTAGRPGSTATAASSRSSAGSPATAGAPGAPAATAPAGTPAGTAGTTPAADGGAPTTRGSTAATSAPGATTPGATTPGASTTPGDTTATTAAGTTATTAAGSPGTVPTPTTPATTTPAGTAPTTVPPTSPTTAPPPTAAPAPAFTATVAAVGPLVAGGTAYLSVAITNTGSAPASGPALTVSLPAGITASAAIASISPGRALPRAALPLGWSCSGTSTLQCTLPSLPVGSSTSTTLAFSVDTAATGSVSFGWKVVQGSVVASGRSASYRVGPPGTFDYYAVDRGNIALIGNTLLSCPAEAGSCVAARAGTATGAKADNDAYPMQPVTVLPSAKSSSSATLTLPAGAQVLYAELAWGGDFDANAYGTPNDPVSVASARFIPSTGVSSRLQSTTVRTATVAGRHLFHATADVTALVQTAGSGSYTVADVGVANGAGSSGGWSLFVAYRDPSQPLRVLAATDGGVALDATTPFSTSLGGLPAAASARAARVAITAYDGDQSRTGESLRLNGADLVNAANPRGNWLNGSVPAVTRSPSFTNQLGFDADIFDSSLAAGVTAATVTASTTTDAAMIGSVFLALDLSP